ncbi:MAG TPA: tripartite tricarboxylate transporter substrate binding protein [Xanthobacteraceae bacterium]|nr:tripartite tricarboxylate transporter substrate binding protein [Xanthobacteraceae bacterium]
MIEKIRDARRVICLALVLSLAAMGAASAQAYPTHPIRWIIGFPPGGPTDILVRIMAEWLQTHLGQPVVVENKPGAASNIATEAVINAAPDGYTIGSVTSANAINATVNKHTLTFDYLKQLIPVSGMSQGPSVLVINPSVPAKTIAELIAYAKANPGRINFGSPGVGSTGHLAAELFKAMAGVDLVHVPYRGAAPAMTDLIGGHVQVLFDSMVSVLPHVQAGRVRALAVTSKARSPLLPDLPAIAETVPGYEAIIWFGVGVPGGTPPGVVARLNRKINAGLASAEMKDKFAKLGTTPMIQTPEEFWAFSQAETAKWQKVIEQAGIKVD